MEADPPTAHYGYDAPGIMLAFLCGGLAGVAGGGLLAAIGPDGWRAIGIGLAVIATVPLFFGLVMALYAACGKRRTRDHILDLAALTGGEQVLDVGTGAGLLLVGAARRVERGHVTGIDIWSSKDLSDNTVTTTHRNARAEGVAARVAVLTGDARRLAFPDARFDRVVSLLCLHNIDGRSDQALACREIARVVKPGGRVVIGDYVPTHHYASILAEAGLHVRQSRRAFGVALSLMWIVVADRRSNAPD